MLSVYQWIFLFVLAKLVVGLDIIPPTGVEIPTHMSNIQYESIQFLKRAANQSASLRLKFNISGLKTAQPKILWSFDEKDIIVGNPESQSNMYAENELDGDGNLISVSLILKNGALKCGTYNMSVYDSVESASGEAIVRSAPILPVYAKPKRVLQGDPLRMSCRVLGCPKPQRVQWLFAPIKVELSDDKAAISDASANLKPIDLTDEVWKNLVFSNEDGTTDDTIKFSELKLAQNGLFACNVSNALGTDSTFLIVAVKDRWAALWPFIGIVVEVTILVIAILLYERYQIRKKPISVSATDNNANVETVPSAGSAGEKNLKSDEVRLRSSRA